MTKGKPTVPLSRRDVNTLYRFLFVMWCRHSERGIQLASGNFDERTRHALDQHLAQNFDGKAVEPLDAWLQNLRQLLDDKMVSVFTDDKIFQHDRIAFETDCRLGKLVIWRSSPEIDFISSLNAFGVYEGWPVDAFTTRVEGMAEGFSLQQGDRAVFARAKVFPIHPNLALAILRPPSGPRGAATSMYDTLLSRRASYFDDFPAYQPEIRYANLSPSARSAQRRGDVKGMEGRKSPEPAGASGSLAVRIDGKILEAREDDMLTFTPGMLTARQTLLVNALVLHRAVGGVVFRTPRDLHHSINTYVNDFVSWEPKKDYSRLLEQLRAVQMGRPIPDESEAQAPAAAPAVEDVPSSRPTSPDMSRPGTPSSPSFGRVSRRQKRRSRLERKSTRDSYGMSPPDSPLMSDEDLPESDFASPLSNTETLVPDGSPMMTSIDMVLSSPRELPKPLARGFSETFEPMIQFQAMEVPKPIQVDEVVALKLEPQVQPQIELQVESQVEPQVVEDTTFVAPSDPGPLGDVFEPAEASELLRDAEATAESASPVQVTEELATEDPAPTAAVVEVVEDITGEHSSDNYSGFNTHTIHPEPTIEKDVAVEPTAAEEVDVPAPAREETVYSDPPLADIDAWSSPPFAPVAPVVVTPWPTQDAAVFRGERTAFETAPVSSVSPFDDIYEIEAVTPAVAYPADSAPWKPAADVRPPSTIDLEELVGHEIEEDDVAVAPPAMLGTSRYVVHSGKAPQVPNYEEDERDDADASRSVSEHASSTDVEEPVVVEKAFGKTEPRNTTVSEKATASDEPTYAAKKTAVEYTTAQRLIAWTALLFVLLFASPFILLRFFGSVVGLRSRLPGAGLSGEKVKN